MADPPAIKTIVLPIDAHGVSRATLDILVRVARQLDCALLGLFVEDARLQRVADLPFATEVVLTSGGERRLQPERLRSHFGKVSRDTRAVLEQLAGDNRVQLTCETASGARLGAVLQRAGGVNIFLPGRERWPARHTPRIRRPAIPRLGVLLGAPEEDQRLLSVAGTLVDAGLVGVVHVLSPGALDAERRGAIERLGLAVRVVRLDGLDRQGVTGLIRRSPYDLQVLPFSCVQEIPPAQLESALDASRGQVLVVT